MRTCFRPVDRPDPHDRHAVRGHRFAPSTGAVYGAPLVDVSLWYPTSPQPPLSLDPDALSGSAVVFCHPAPHCSRPLWSAWWCGSIWPVPTTQNLAALPVHYPRPETAPASRPRRSPIATHRSTSDPRRRRRPSSNWPLVVGDAELGESAAPLATRSSTRCYALVMSSSRSYDGVGGTGPAPGLQRAHPRDDVPGEVPPPELHERGALAGTPPRPHVAGNTTAVPSSVDVRGSRRPRNPQRPGVVVPEISRHVHRGDACQAGYPPVSVRQPGAGRRPKRPTP